MFRLTLCIASVALAGCASTGDWRALQIDGSDESSFEESVVSIQQASPYKHSYMFTLALQDIWVTARAGAGGVNESAFTEQDYLAQLDGLRYDDVISLADSAGPSTLFRYTTRQPVRGRGSPEPAFRAPQQSYQYVAPGRAPAWASNPWAGISPWGPANHP